MLGNGAAGASYGDLLVTSLVVLGAVCIAAFVVVRLVGRFVTAGRSRGAELLEVVARLPLEPRRSLYVIEVAGKTLLLGTSEMGLSVLSELDGGEVRARTVERPSFGALVRTAWLRRRSAGPREPHAGDAASLAVVLGGAAAGPDVVLGGAAAGPDVVLGGAAAGPDVVLGGAAAGPDVVLGGGAAGPDVVLGGGAAGPDVVLGGAAAGPGVVLGGAAAGPDIARSDGAGSRAARPQVHEGR